MPRTTRSADLSQTLGRALRARRQEIGLSQAEVARRLDVSTTYVQAVERGGSNLTVGQLARVCDALEAYPRIQLVSLPAAAPDLGLLPTSS